MTGAPGLMGGPCKGTVVANTVCSTKRRSAAETHTYVEGARSTPLLAKVDRNTTRTLGNSVKTKP